MPPFYWIVSTKSGKWAGSYIYIYVLGVSILPLFLSVPIGFFFFLSLLLFFIDNPKVNGSCFKLSHDDLNKWKRLWLSLLRCINTSSPSLFLIVPSSVYLPSIILPLNFKCQFSAYIKAYKRFDWEFNWTKLSFIVFCYILLADNLRRNMNKTTIYTKSFQWRIRQYFIKT